VPLPGHAVVPDRWETHHAAPAAGAQTGRCRITRPAGGTGVLDPATGTVTAATPEIVYDGPFRAVALVADQATPMAGQQVTHRDYLWQVDRSTAGIRVDDTVTVLDATDPDLLTARLHVVDVQAGSLRFARDLRVRLDQG
jgi:hypothetical protein